MDYNLYLFSNLVKLYNADFNNLEYDLQFEQLSSMYDDFLNSSFNDSKFGEYDCIVKYLIYKYGEKQERTISIVWSIEDVYERAEHCQVELTEKEALEVLSNLKNKHDAEIGINWDVIDSMISYIVADSQFEEEEI